MYGEELHSVLFYFCLSSKMKAIQYFIHILDTGFVVAIKHTIELCIIHHDLARKNALIYMSPVSV